MTPAIFSLFLVALFSAPVLLALALAAFALASESGDVAIARTSFVLECADRTRVAPVAPVVRRPAYFRSNEEIVLLLVSRGAGPVSALVIARLSGAL